LCILRPNSSRTSVAKERASAECRLLILPPGFVAVNPLPSRQCNEGQEGVRAPLKITVSRQMHLYALTSSQVVQAPHYSTSLDRTNNPFSQVIAASYCKRL
jgi:hypothetical protein